MQYHPRWCGELGSWPQRGPLSARFWKSRLALHRTTLRCRSPEHQGKFDREGPPLGQLVHDRVQGCHTMLQPIQLQLLEKLAFCAVSQMLTWVYIAVAAVAAFLSLQSFRAFFGFRPRGQMPAWGPGPNPTFQCGSDMRWYDCAVAHQQRHLEGPLAQFSPVFWSCVSPEEGGGKCYGLGDRYRGIERVLLIAITVDRPFLLASTYEGDVQHLLMPREVYWNVTDVPGLEVWGTEVIRPPPAYDPGVFEYMRGDLQREPFEDSRLWSNGTTRFAWNRRAGSTSKILEAARRYWKGEAPDEVKVVLDSLMTIPNGRRFGCLFHTLFRVAPELQESVALSLFEVCQKIGVVPPGADFERWIHRPGLRQFFALRYGNLWLPRVTMTDAITVIFPRVRRSEVPPIVSIHFRAGGKSLSWYTEGHRTSLSLVNSYVQCGIQASSPAKGKVLFASDSSVAKAAAQEFRPDDVITLDATEVPKHIYHSHHGLQGALETYTELLLLSLGHKFIATRSGFGRIAAMMGFLQWNDVYVRSPGPATLSGCQGFSHAAASSIN